MAHPGGRPLKFKTPEELETKANAYFENTKKQDWTITGLAIYLDTFKDVLMDYGKRDEFSSLIKKLRQKVESSYEDDLKKHGRPGTIFALKNFNWKDKFETDVTSGGKPIPILSHVSTNPSDHKDTNAPKKN